MLKALQHLKLRVRIAWLEYRHHSAQSELEGFAEAQQMLQLQMQMHAASIAAWDQEIAALQARLPPEPLPRSYGGTL
jgi:hypothetical protein